MQKRLLEEITTIIDTYKIKPVLKAIIEAGGTSYLVGGSVRDIVLEFPAKDIDIEIHNISLEDLEKCLAKFGPVKLVGKQFGVLRSNGLDIDWSVPRKDSKGRKPTVVIDPDMGIKEACRRRDITINAMAIDLGKILQNEVELLDPFNGLDDIKSKTLHFVDEKLFYDDPLRFYRVVQFISRFEMQPDDALTNVCKKIDLEGVAKERIYEELKKLMLRSQRPSLGLRFIQKIDRLKEIMPELYDLIGVQQPKEHHPEGDVFEHSMQSLDAAAVFDQYEDEYEKLIIMFASLCHDFGKPATTDEELHAIDHDKVGVDITAKFLKRFGADNFLIKAVKKMVRHHMMPFILLEQGSSLSAYRRLARKLEPEVSLRQLGIVALCDGLGRNPKSQKPLPISQEYKELIEAYINKIREAEVEHSAQKQVLLGRHIIDIVPPGKEMGEILKAAYEIQIEEGITDVEELRKRVLKNYKNRD